MGDTLDEDDVPELVHDERVVRACLGCFCAGPQDVADGERVLLLEDDEGHPVASGHIGLVFDSTAPPLVALSRADYEHAQTVATRPWAAAWKVIRPEDRLLT
ncbi:MAG: hypothetical protein ACYCSX_17190 [Acidimicrobiales bacterium]